MRKLKKSNLVIILLVLFVASLAIYSYTATQESTDLLLQVDHLRSELAQQDSAPVVAESSSKITSLEAELVRLENESTEYKTEINKLLRNSLTPPYTTIKANQLVTAFIMTDGTPYAIQTPVVFLLDDLAKKDNIGDSYSYLAAKLGGKNHNVVDMKSFVDPTPFIPEMTVFSEKFASDEEIIHEIWYMVTQFNTYVPELGENPQSPSETLFLATGDCEDSSILIASLFKAIPRDWEVSFIYTDYFNPGNPFEINHILVSVDTGSEIYFIETTSPENINPHGEVGGYKVVV